MKTLLVTTVLLLVLAGIVMARTIGTDSNRSAATPLNPGGNHAKRNLTVGPIQFQTIPREQQIAYPHAGIVEVNDPQTWAGVWKASQICVIIDGLGCAPAPQVNFTTETILVVSAGLEGSAGYQINITHITGTKDKIIVEATLTTPGQNCLEALALTYPTQVVEIAKTDLPATLELATTQAPPCPL